MSLWEYQACVEGYQRANNPSHSVNSNPLSDADYEALCALGEKFSGQQ